MVDYYATLEVSKSSSKDEIRQAYRKLALKWHPDKNPKNQEVATKKFKEISEAYEVLSDDSKRRAFDLSRSSHPGRGSREKHKKRRMYDQYGRDSLNASMNGGGHSGSTSRHGSGRAYRYDAGLSDFEGIVFGFPNFVFRDPQDVFREFFGGADPFEDIMDPFSLLGGLHGVHRHPRRHGRGSSFEGSRRYHPHQQQPCNTIQVHSQMVDPFAGFGGGLMSPFGGFGLFAPGGASPFDIGAGAAFNGSIQTFSSSFGGPGGGGANVHSSSTSTKFVNGKKVTTQRIFENGVETVKTYENDVLKGHTVNGEHQSIQNQPRQHQSGRRRRT